MKKALVLGIIILLLPLAIHAAELEQTTIDYTQYRESSGSELVYKIKITNNADKKKMYEIIPQTEAIRNLGTYRLEPTRTITLKAGETKTTELIIFLDQKIDNRVTIPVDIVSGYESTTLTLSARPQEGYQTSSNNSWLTQVLRIAFYTLLILIIILLIVRFIRRKKKKGDENASEIETYY